MVCQPEKGAFAYNAYKIKKDPYNKILFYIVMPSRWQQIHWLIHSTNSLENIALFQNETNNFINEGIIDSFTQPIC